MKEIKKIIQLSLAVFIIFVFNGCLPLEKELQVMLNQHNITKKTYIKNNTYGYDDYLENKKVLQALLRGEEYEIIDIKNGYALLKRSANNKLKQNIWVSIDALETQPTYFISFIINAKNPNIFLNGVKYESHKRLPKGNYEVKISANDYLDKYLIIELKRDTIKEIDLDFDEEKEQKRIEKEKQERLKKEQIKQEKLKQQKLKKEKLKKERIAREIQKSIYIDKKQKLMWQDNNDTIIIKKTWLTQLSYDTKNYNDTKGDTASTYCQNLSLANFKDWRLPTKDELKHLSSKKDLLKHVIHNWYWSSTTSDNDSSRAWSIYFNNSDGYTDLKNNSNYVRCVRTGIR